MDLWSFNLRHLAAAAATCRLGTVSAAAAEVSLTQPAITQALAKLEARLGISLFERRPDGMAAAEAARLLAERVERMQRFVGSRAVTMAQFRALIALADAGSYSGASVATGLSQPSLHRSVADLSVILRLQLTERRGKGLGLTEHGRRTVRAFRLARAELVAALAEIEALKGREVGRIAVGAMPLSRARLLPAAVTAFHRDYPEIAVSIAEGSFAELIDPLRDGDLDLLIGALRDPPASGDIEQRALFDDRPVVIARKGHPLSGRDPAIADLAAFPWTIAPRGAPLRAQWQRMFAGTSSGEPSVPVECGSVMTIRQILLDSDFLTLLSVDQVTVELEAGWLEIICGAPVGLKRTIGITTRAGWRPTRAQQAFVDRLLAGGSG